MPLGYMELILTSNCNLRCSYCFEKDKVAVDMTEETAFASVDFFIDASQSMKNLTFLYFGGEPMMRFDLMQSVYDYATKAAQKAGKTISWNMTTNGTLIDETKARWLAEHKIKYLLSMDGGQEDHDRYRRFPNGKGSFELLAKRLPMMKRYQPWMGVKMSISPEAALRLTQNIKELRLLGLNQFLIGYAHGLDWDEQSIFQYEKALMELAEFYFEMKSKRAHNIRISRFEEDAMVPSQCSTYGCGAGRGRFCVLPEGDIYGCSKLATICGPKAGILPMGNVFQGIHCTGNRNLLLDATITKRKKCKVCELRERCAGGCPATNYYETGDFFECGDIACKLTYSSQRFNRYFKKRHDEVFGTNWRTTSPNDFKISKNNN